MRKFEAVIRNLKNKQNLIIISVSLFQLIISGLIIFALFFFIFNLSSTYQAELFLLALSLKIIIALLLIYLFLQTSRNLINNYQAARNLDKFNQDLSDTYQNAYELSNQTEKYNSHILNRIYDAADLKAETQIIKTDKRKLNQVLFPLLITVFITILIYFSDPAAFKQTLAFLKLNKLPPAQHKEFVEVYPGDLQVVRNSRVEIGVDNPEAGIIHQFFYKISDSWREESLYDHKRVFPNLDFSFSYFVKTPYAVSDTFTVEVFELPAVKNIDLKYDYPSYTELDPVYESNSSGIVKAIIGTEVTLVLEANNPIEQANIIFSDGSLQELERMGRSSFKISFTIEENGSYHFNLIDILGNRSDKISRSITVIPDKEPEIRIISPGKDTLLTQNMLLPLKIYAVDDFGLKNLKLKYDINSREINSIDLQEKISEKILNYEYILDLTGIFLIPGDKVTYWTEISDNSPRENTVSSRKFVAKFPSIEEIYQEIEREEQTKSDLLKNTLEKSRDLQEQFAEKQREMMKKDEFDWEDKKELEDFLKQQEDLNKNIENIAEDYQNLIEKFEDNRALSTDTLEKMEKIKELMEEIANDDLLEAMEKMRDNLKNVDPETMKEAMKNLKFSLDEFSQKLEQTIDLLEAIKKEQAVQKSLEIAEEMEEMQSDLNERTKDSEENNDKLAQDQQTISDKLQSLLDQLEKTAQLMDPQKDSELKKSLEELLEKIKQDSLSNDIQEITENLKSNNCSSAQQNQQKALEKMQNITQQLSSMQQNMACGAMMEMGDIINKTIKRLVIFSKEHEYSSNQYTDDPFFILRDQIAVFEGITLTLSDLYSVPMIFLVLGPKFIYDANFTNVKYQELFSYINEAKKYNVKGYLKDIQKGINLMIYDLIQANNNMQQGGGGGSMESLMQAMQQMGQQQMMMNMMTMELMQQLGQNGRMNREMLQESQRLAAEEQRLADNLKRILQNDPEAQKQTSALNQIIDDLESISRNLKQGRINQDLIDTQERILSRLLDAQKSIHKREFSRKRKAEISEVEAWDLPEEIKLKFEQMRQKALLNEDYLDFPKEYRELIEAYLKLLNEKANELDQ